METWLQPSSTYRGTTRKLEREGLFIRESTNRIEDNDFKLKESRFRLDIWKKFFTDRMVRHKHMLPREAADAPSLEAYKTGGNPE